MKNGLKNTLIFAGGGIAGAATAYFAIKRFLLEKWKRDVLDAIEAENTEYEAVSGEEYFVESLDQEHIQKVISERKELNKPDIDEYMKTIKKHGYKAPDTEPVDYTSFAKNNEKPGNKEPVEEKGNGDDPRIVTEDYFDELSDEEYHFIEFSYFEDKVVADENNEKMEDEEIERTIGKEALKYLDEHEDESVVYVVNERLKAAYDVIKDLRYYSDVAEAKGE